jgi:hypothetical protein
MHRKDDQYSPILLLVMENDCVELRIVSAQKPSPIHCAVTSRSPGSGNRPGRAGHGRQFSEPQGCKLQAASGHGQPRRVPSAGVPKTNSTNRHMCETRQQSRHDSGLRPEPEPQFGEARCALIPKSFPRTGPTDLEAMGLRSMPIGGRAARARAPHCGGPAKSPPKTRARPMVNRALTWLYLW